MTAFALVAASMLAAACDSLSGGKPLAVPKGYEFPGAKVLVPNDDGTFNLTWPVSPLKESSYRIFQRAEGQEFDWAKPSTQVKDTIWRTSDLRLAPVHCFAVRFSAPGYDGDKNTKEVCTPKSTYKFAGLKGVTRTEEGAWTLDWEPAPFKGVTYRVHLADPNGAMEAAPLREVSEASTRVGPFPLGTVKCFVVRLALSGKSGQDANTNTKCTDANQMRGFNGIDGAESPGTGLVQLKWTPSGNEDVEGYLIYRGATFSDVVGKVSPRQVGSYTVKDLVPGAKETFGIRAVSAKGLEDENRRTITVTVKDLRPLKFAGLASASVSGKGEVLLRWPSHPEAKGYRVYKWTGEAGGSPFLTYDTPYQTHEAEPEKEVIELRVRGLGDEQSHAFVVRAVSAFDVEDRNEAFHKVTLPDQGPPVFKGVKGAANLGGKIQLVWDAPLGQTTKFRIYKAQGGASSIDFSSSAIPPEPGSATSALLSGFQANKAYTFVVRAEDQNGNLDSNSASVTIVAGQQSLPEFAGYVSALPGREGEIKVDWLSSPGGGVKSYLIQWRKPGTQTWSTATILHSNDPTKSWTISGLQSKTRYEIRVKAVDFFGNESGNDELRTVQTTDETPPEFSGAASADQAPGAASVTVTWPERPTNDIHHFRVYWSESHFSNFDVAGLHHKKPLPTLPSRVWVSPVVDGGATSYEVTNLVKGRTYHFVVHAVDDAANEESNLVGVSTTVLNSFPTLSASASNVRSAERVPSETVVLTASDVNTGDTLVIEQLTTTCPVGFDAPSIVVQAQANSSRTARVDWTPSQNFIEGNREERTCAVTFRVGDGESYSPVAVVSFTAFNRAPRNLVVGITPQVGGFKRSRTLECTATALDDDGNPLVYQYQWVKNGVPLAGQTATSLPPAAGAFAPGDTFTCNASAFDDHARVEAASPAVTFGNEPPSINSVGILEDGGLSPLNVGDRVACTWNVSDPDNDAVTLESIVVEGSDDGSTGWAPLALDNDSCTIIQATRRCFAISTVARRKYLRCSVGSVSDGYAVTPGRSSTTPALVANAAPRIVAASITPTGTIARGNTLTCQVETSDADGDSLSAAPSVQWTRDNVAVSGATASTYAVDLADRGKGLRCEASLPFNADGFGSPASAVLKSAPRTYTNSDPVITQVGVLPAVNVATGTTLSCMPVVSDPDADSVTLGAPYGSYTWYMNSGTGNQEIPGQTNSTLVVTQDLRGKDLRCAYGLAANSDGNGAGVVVPVISANKVTPLNSAPVISDVSVSSSATPAITGTVLTCNRTIADPDGDALVDNPRYSWKANGTTLGGASGQTYVMKRADRGKQVTCGVSLLANSDGRAAPAVPEVVSSNNFVSTNSQPSVANVAVTSLFAPPFYPTTLFTCTNYTIDDADSDPIFPTFKWYLDDVEIPGASQGEFVARSADRGGHLRCAVHLPANSDGAGSTEVTSKSANAMLVQNRAPVASFLPTIEVIGGGAAYKTTTLRCRVPSSVTVRDPDGDSVTDRFIWRKGPGFFPGTDGNGSANPDLALTSDDSITPGQTITCMLRMDDGRTAVESAESPPTTVANRNPVPSGTTISVSPATIIAPTNGQVLTCNAPSFTDPDGDIPQVRYSWRIRSSQAGSWNLLASNQTTNTITYASGTTLVWQKGNEIVCSVTVSDSQVTLGSAIAPGVNGATLPLAISTASVPNSPPVGTFKCNGNNTPVVNYANATLTSTSGCLTTNSITDGDGDAIAYLASSAPAETTCPGVGTTLFIDPTDGRISGIMPAASCQITIIAQDTSNALVRESPNGVVAKAVIPFQLPFTALFGEPALDSNCKLTLSTSFTSGTVSFGTSTASFSAMVQGPHTHVGANTGNGEMSGYLNPAGGGGSAQASWTVNGSSGGFSTTVSKAFSVVDSAASPDVPASPIEAPGLQVPPKYDGSGERAASCGLENCQGRLGFVAAGYAHTCTTTADGTLYCWGQNSTGELGRGNTITPSPSTPGAVNLGTDKVKAASAGGSILLEVSHTCAIVEDRSTTPAANKGVKCWGNNAFGQIGNGTYASSAPYNVTSPTQVTGLAGGTGTSAVRAIVSGGAHTCVLMGYASAVSGGAVRCWGHNDRGQLGVGTTQSELSPAQVQGFQSSGALGLAAGSRHTCAITNAHTVKCWGDNEDLQLGVATSAAQGHLKTSPVDVPNLTNVVALAAGDKHTCALRANGEVKCWGNQSEGRLGNNELGGKTETPQPLTGSVLGSLKATAIAAGGAHTCAIVEGGGARCWGNNQQGQLGDNTAGNYKPTPIPVLDLNGTALGVEAGFAHTCILKNTGGVACFGFYNAVGLESGQQKPVNNAMPVSAQGIPAASYQNCRALRILKD